MIAYRLAEGNPKYYLIYRSRDSQVVQEIAKDQYSHDTVKAVVGLMNSAYRQGVRDLDASLRQSFDLARSNLE